MYIIENFNYHKFLDKLKAELPDDIERYENHVGPLGATSLHSEKWYTSLVKPFPTTDLILKPENVDVEFDWRLLVQLGAASISSEADFLPAESGVHLIFRVQNHGASVTKRLDELFYIQIFRLFEIWISENINLMALACEYEEEKTSLFKEKRRVYEQWKLRYDKFLSKIQGDVPTKVYRTVRSGKKASKISFPEESEIVRLMKKVGFDID